MAMLTCFLCLSRTELFYDRGNSYEFTSLVRQLEGPGTVTDVKPFPFAFENVEKKFESYSGINVRLRCEPLLPRCALRTAALTSCCWRWWCSGTSSA